MAELRGGTCLSMRFVFTRLEQRESGLKEMVVLGSLRSETVEDAPGFWPR